MQRGTPGHVELIAAAPPVRPAAGDQAKLKVFVSYSRRDLDFADQLAAVLEYHGFTVIIDRKGIHGAEQWQQRLGQMILESDTVVFVLSPDAAASEVRRWEVEEAARRAKRIVPVLCRELGVSRPHDLLRDLNYIYFYQNRFGRIATRGRPPADPQLRQNGSSVSRGRHARSGTARPHR